MTNNDPTNAISADAQPPIIRALHADDNAALAAVIREVSAEYGLTPDKGFSVADKTLDCLSEVYDAQGSQYWVIEYQGKVVGGAGVAPLPGNDGVCELQKMYFARTIRGQGIAKAITGQCIEFAKQQGYQSMYLETTAVLVEALALYEKLGFSHCQHLGETGHDACEIAMIKPI
ncbi:MULTISPECIES: GNAT family N-acetyltransferase [Shewanella]|jgi:putative acetyltransferase|uniref:GNAT family N-acetyltransferase n=1 Tax=Shewanella TaxID=22 RepID=UPI00160030E2|nr:GNAT family N-acetyltransferase [Shewanella sp. SR43-8]MBB1321486.1 GNAT family N-acetyltransferase [Shewanella sp. SR43-8]